MFFSVNGKATMWHTPCLVHGKTEACHNPRSPDSTNRMPRSKHSRLYEQDWGWKARVSFSQNCGPREHSVKGGGVGGGLWEGGASICVKLGIPTCLSSCVIRFCWFFLRFAPLIYWTILLHCNQFFNFIWYLMVNKDLRKYDKDVNFHRRFHFFLCLLVKVGDIFQAYLSSYVSV
jgi:hypothetical protein